MSVTQSGRGPVIGTTSGYELVQGSREFLTLRRRLGYFVVPVTVMFLGWYFLYVILAAFAPGFMRVSVFGLIIFSPVFSGHAGGLGGAVPSLISDPHINFAFFALDNPGIVSIPLAFFLGWLGSVADPNPGDPARFARMQVRALTGIGAERGSHG